ncbi:MAG: D-3-phosphoglycerate dehydrogenase / 2-oxoglutarate reductase [Thermoleophilaceae bacterium]|jgi:D-3-phosphoglycerate dehydrogenase|nr:D-3-phosphoglycerate dehydrogenase / 2-oxoglutarate reductase [Thermoleophilaceae bacterium]
MAPARTQGGTVLVTSRSFGSGHVDTLARLRERGLDAVRAGPGHDAAALADGLGRAVAWIAGTAPIGAEQLELAPGLRVIARYGVGYDAVDLGAAAARGIAVTHTPGANSEAVADHTLALLLAALRHVVAGDGSARAGDWRARPGRELAALTAGIVGFGKVGRAVARRLTGGFGTRVVVHDPYVADDAVRQEGCEPMSLDALAAEADVLCLHAPGAAQPLVDAALLRRLRPEAILVNAARGDLVDERAVAEALRSGRLGAAAVDVLATEPASGSPLLDAPNVVVTPHLAAQTVEAIDRMGTMAVDDVLRVLDGLPAIHPVPPVQR